jgi:membrane protease subunit HflK
MEEANGYKGRLIATAEGDASRFSQILTEYSKAPEVTRSRLYLETLQQIYANTSKVMIDAKGQGNLLYLPLDKLMQAAGAQAAAPSADTQAAPAARSNTPAPASSNDAPPQLEKMPSVERSGDYRSRDFLRSRERGDR